MEGASGTECKGEGGGENIEGAKDEAMERLRCHVCLLLISFVSLATYFSIFLLTKCWGASSSPV